MKRFRALVAALLATWLVLSLAACGRGGGITTKFEDLLARDYEIYYIFYTRGLPLEEGTEPISHNGGSYLPVASKDYRKLSDLERLLQSTYAQDSTVQAFMDLGDGSGHALFTEIDGKLCQSTLGDIQMLRFEQIDGKLTPTAEEKDHAAFTLEEQSLDGSLYLCEMSMTRTGKGWRLDTPRKDAKRTLLREGSEDDTLAGAGSARDVAEAFLSALQRGDSTALDTLTTAPEGTYSGWAATEVTSAAITETLEEADSYGRYQVKLQVQNGAGILPEGENAFVLEVGFYDFSEYVSVCYFKPAEPTPYSRLPYEERTDPASEAVINFINFFGLIEFKSSSDLSPEVIAEYCLSELGSDMTFEQAMDGISPKDLAAAAEKRFGVEDFSAADTPFYNAETDSYMSIGRGGYQINYAVWGSTKQEDDTVSVSVSAYSDPLQYQGERTFTYTLRLLDDGSVQFIRAVKD